MRWTKRLQEVMHLLNDTDPDCKLVDSDGTVKYQRIPCTNVDYFVLKINSSNIHVYIYMYLHRFSFYFLYKFRNFKIFIFKCRYKHYVFFRFKK